MKGSPLLRIALALLGISFTAVPLLRLTGARDSIAAPAPVSLSMPPKETPVTLRLRFSPALIRARVLHEGRELLSVVEPSEWSLASEASLPIVPEGIELEVHAEWPGNTEPAALTLEVEPSGLETLSQTAWTSEAELLEFFTFRWN
jgi:hypothetical protein